MIIRGNGLTHGDSPFTCLQACPFIFKKRIDGALLGLSSNFFNAKYSNEPLKGYLNEWLGANLRLGDLEKKVVLTSFKVDGTRSRTHRAQEQTNLRRARGLSADPGAAPPAAPRSGSGRWRPAVFTNLPVSQRGRAPFALAHVSHCHSRMSVRHPTPFLLPPPPPGCRGRGWERYRAFVRGRGPPQFRGPDHATHLPGLL